MNLIFKANSLCFSLLKKEKLQMKMKNKDLFKK